VPIRRFIGLAPELWPLALLRVMVAGGMIGLGRLKQGLATLLDVRALCSHVDVAAERKERWVV